MQRLDYETAIDHRYRFFVTANNVHVDPALPVAEDTTEVIVEVSDVNEPPEFRKTEYIFSGVMLCLCLVTNLLLSSELVCVPTTNLEKEPNIIKK